MRSSPNIGDSFGRLTIQSLAYKKYAKKHWLCVCVCGGTTITTTQKLRSGHTKSCGCLVSETAIRLIPIRSRHGHCKTGTTGVTPTYRTWHAMMGRCFNINHKDYMKYGYKGITVCERWKKFDHFLMDMGERPEGTSIDRINGLGDYEPDNCRWATPKEQSRNQKSNKLNCEKAENIRKMPGPARVAAIKYNVSVATVTAIRRNQTWT